MKNYLIPIACIVIIIFLISGIFFGYFFLKKKWEKQKTELIQTNEKKEAYYKELLEKEKNKKPITIKEIQVMTDTEKEQTIIRLQEEKKELLIAVEDLNNQLSKSTIELKKQYKLKNSIDAIGMIGTDEDVKLDVWVGVEYKRTFYISDKLAFNLGGGVAVKIKHNLGGAGIISLGFKF